MALQMVFQSDMGKQNEDDVRKTFWAERSTVDKETREVADDLFRVARERSTETDEPCSETHRTLAHRAHACARAQPAASRRGRIPRLSQNRARGRDQ